MRLARRGPAVHLVSRHSRRSWTGVFNRPLTIPIYGSVKFGAVAPPFQSGNDVAGPSTTDTTPPLGAVHALLLAAGVAGVTPTFPAHAQDAGTLRGTVRRDRCLPLATSAAASDAGTAAAMAPTQTHPRSPTAASAPAAACRSRRRCGPRQTQPTRRPERSAPAPTIESQEDPELTKTRVGSPRIASKPIEGADRERSRHDKPETPSRRRASGSARFILKPTVEQGVTVTSNADSSTNGSGAVLSETMLRLNAVSDWSSHSATIDAFGIFRKTDFGRRDRRLRGRHRRRARTRARQGLSRPRHARLCETPGIGDVAGGHRRRGLAAASRDPHRQPRSRKGRRQGAFRGHRRRRAATVMATPSWKPAACYRRRTATRRCTSIDAARRLRDFAGADAVRRSGSRPPRLRLRRGQPPATPVRPTSSRLAPDWRSISAKSCPASSRPAGFARVRRPTVWIPISGPTIDAAIWPGRRCAAPSST